MIYLYFSVLANYVALPGAGGIEPTILEALNRNIASDGGSEPQTETESHPEENKPEISNQPDDDETLVNDQSGNSSPGDLNADRPEASFSDEPTSDDVTDGSHIFDIESHLIETLENYSVSEQSDTSGVTVEEVPPAKEELSRPSTVESETSPKTVIEIQPSLPKLHKSIKSEVHQSALEPEVGFAAGSRRPSENLTEKEGEPVISLTSETKEKINESVCDTKNGLQKENELETTGKSKSSKVEIVTPVEIQKDLIWSPPHVEETVEYVKSEIKDSSKPKTDQTNNQHKPSIQIENLDQLKCDQTKDNTATTKKHQQREPKSTRDSDIFKPNSTDKDTSESELPLKDTDIIKPEIADNRTKSSKSNESLKTTLKDDSLKAEQITETKQEPSSTKKDSDEIKSQLKDEATTADIKESSTEEAATAEVKKLLEDQLATAEVEQKLEEEPQKVEEQGLQTSECEQTDEPQLGINGLPISTTQSEEEAKKSFLESIPQLIESEANTLSTQAKKEYYQSLRDYLIKQKEDRPPVPLQTYRWEDLRRAKQHGGYPWTHLYKRPLGPHEEPEIVLLLRKSQELQRLPSESPKSLKKVRIHDQVLVKETERYISDLSDTENTEEDKEDNKSVQSESASASESEDKKNKTSKIRSILKRGRSKLAKLDLSPSKSKSIEPEAAKSIDSPKKIKCCPPIMDKLKIMADKQLKKRHIKKVPLKSDEKIVLSEEQKILKLKTSPKAERSEIPHFVEKQDSDEILEIVDLEESPSKIRKRREELAGEHPASSVLVPDEIIEIPQPLRNEETEKTDEGSHPTPEPTISEILDEEMKSSPPQKAPRKKKEHFYEDIDNEELGQKIDEILEEAVIGALKRSLATQDEAIKQDINVRVKLEKMGSSEEDQDKTISRLAPLSSIDSASSEEDRKPPLSTLAEESDQESCRDDLLSDKEATQILKIVEEHEREELLEPELKSVLKREPSPGSDKKVTFSHVEDDAEPHREDIELPEHVILDKSRWSKISDHEYEPIGEPIQTPAPSKPAEEREPTAPSKSQPIPNLQLSEPMEIDEVKTVGEATGKSDLEAAPEEASAQELQRDIEERYFSSATTTPRTESRTDYEIHTSQVDSSALEELPLKPENRKKGFMASAQDKSRKVQANLRSQAGKIRTKLRGMKKPASGSPKAKERKRFKAPEFSKIKLPEMKRPELPKFKTPEMPKFKTPEFKKIEFKRPEFTKFSKPDMSKFKIPEKFSSLKLKRSRSLKEAGASMETTSGTTPESGPTPVKKKFEFNFGTYPRALRKKKERIATQVIAQADDAPSSETPPSLESTTILRGERDKGPVGSRWIDKFSDVSYGDSESGKYRRYGSEVESLERVERDSSVERRMKEDLDQSTQDENEEEIAGLETVEQKQFAEYDEENRAIHEISKSREGEFKKRHPMIHQDSDLVSEESKDVGWTEKEILRNKILRGSEMEAENYPSEEGLTGSITNTNHETQSTGSSGQRQKGVLEEIDDDQFFLRKRGISQDNIEIRQYISSAIREGFDTPLNALAQLGDSQGMYPEMDSTGQVNYGYDVVPPPKPRRSKLKYSPNVDSQEVSQEFDIEQKENYDDNISLPQTSSDYYKNFSPNRPLRKSKKQYSQDSQDVPDSELPYDDEDDRMFYKEENNNLEIPEITRTFIPSDDFKKLKTETPPKAPKRRKKQIRESVEKDSFVNGFGGRSISNTYLPEDNQVEQLIVYRTEHEYIIPLAQAENFATPTPPTRSRSRSRITDDDRTSRGADSLASDIQEEEDRFFVEMKENDGYAVVRKEPPPRPPPPVRRKRSPLPIIEDKFATMPHLKSDAPPPERPKRNYSTIGPSRPPRRKSSASIEETQKEHSPDVTQYEELDEVERPESPKHLVSGDVINKMKYRPLPPPPRPPRDNKRRGGDKYDKDAGGEKIAFDYQQNGNYEIDKPVEKCIEVEVSTQTDPLPDDFVCEEFEITEDMKIIEPRRSKTLEDILKEEQEAEIERARQLAEEENLTKSLQRFREAGQRSFSERSRGSTEGRSRTHSRSRPATPSAVIIEKRVPTPIPHRVNETMLSASLIVQPVDDFDIDEEMAREFQSEEKLEEQIAKSDVSSQRQEEEERLTVDYSSDQRSVTSEQRAQDTQESQIQSQSEQEEQERTLLQQFRDERKTESEPEEPAPQPPPRKRSSVPSEDASAIIPREEPPAEPELAVVPEHPPTEISPSNRLAIADLEVERLSVHALQAGRIMVSQLQGSQISADDLECKSGNLVVTNMQIPPGLIEQIIERVRSTERDHSQAQTQTTETEETGKPAAPQEEAPARPPPPQQPVIPPEYFQHSLPPPSFYQLRNPSDEEHHSSHQIHRRRRHHRRRDSSSEDESYREHRRSRQETRSPEPTVAQLSGQLLRLCGSQMVRTMNQIVNYLQSAQKEGTDRSMTTAIAVLILMALGFLLLGMSGKNIHHHHWDYFNPPGNDGRGQ